MDTKAQGPLSQPLSGLNSEMAEDRIVGFSWIDLKVLRCVPGWTTGVLGLSFISGYSWWANLSPISGTSDVLIFLSGICPWEVSGDWTWVRGGPSWLLPAAHFLQYLVLQSSAYSPSKKWASKWDNQNQNHKTSLRWISSYGCLISLSNLLFSTTSDNMCYRYKSIFMFSFIF